MNNCFVIIVTTKNDIYSKQSKISSYIWKRASKLVLDPIDRDKVSFCFRSQNLILKKNVCNKLKQG